MSHSTVFSDWNLGQKVSCLRKRPLRALLLVSLLHMIGCSAIEPPPPLVVSNPPAFRPKTPQEVTSLQQAIATIMTVCSEDLALPPVEPLYLHVYKDAKTYTASTQRFATVPEDFVRFTLAQSHANRLHVNLERARAQSWAALLRRLAHDYGHNLEYVLAGRTQASRRWMTEGFAEWVAAKVLSSLGWESFSSTLSRAERELLRYGLPLPRLTELETDSGWSKTLEEPNGPVRTYHSAFLAVNQLIEKRGLPALMNYFSTEDFAGNFGLTATELERDLQTNFSERAAAKAVASDLNGAKPGWKPGYQWQYALGAPGLKTTVLVPNKVSREEIFENTPAYVLVIGSNEYPHAEQTMGVLATLSGGKTISKNNPPSLPLAWPLEVGKQWRNAFTVESGEQKRSPKIDTEVVVAAVEDVRVPAGTFQAFRVETYAALTGELISEQWYAPQVKWLVKSKIYREEGVIEQELVKFDVD